MKTSTRNWTSLVFAVYLVLLLPATFRFRSPGSISPEWFLCAAATAGLILFNGLGLKSLWQEKQSNRFLLYITTGVAVGVAFMLLNVWQGQQQFDFWAHHGISYFVSR